MLSQLFVTIYMKIFAILTISEEKHVDKSDDSLLSLSDNQSLTETLKAKTMEKIVITYLSSFYQIGFHFFNISFPISGSGKAFGSTASKLLFIFSPEFLFSSWTTLQ